MALCVCGQKVLSKKDFYVLTSCNWIATMVVDFYQESVSKNWYLPKKAQMAENSLWGLKDSYPKQCCYSQLRIMTLLANGNFFKNLATFAVNRSGEHENIGSALSKITCGLSNVFFWHQYYQTSVLKILCFFMLIARSNKWQNLKMLLQYLEVWLKRTAN